MGTSSLKRAVTLVVAATLAGLMHPVLAADGSAQPNTKACFGSPPRQTEDPESPPCIPFYDGDNGGATAPGVTADEIRVTIRIDGGVNYLPTSGEPESVHAGQIYDLDEPDSADTPSQVRGARAYQTWFNQRYQTYDRRLHLFVYTSNASEAPESARADAADIVALTDPFAVIDASTHPGFPDFASKIASLGRVAISDSPAFPEATARSYPGQIWSAQPSDEVNAKLFTSYACSQHLGHQPKALVRTTDPMYPGLERQGELVRAGLRACGIRIDIEMTFPQHGNAFDLETALFANDLANARRMQSSGVDTIFMAGGYDAELVRAAAAIGYTPQWVIAGDGVSEGKSGGRYAAGWIRSTAVAANLEAPPWTTKPCQLALADDPALSPAARVRSCEMYEGLRLTANGIQVAGPQLTSSSFDAGLHAIPRHTSAGPQSPACYFDLGDYSCSKDVAIAHWDPSGFNPDAAPGALNSPGCWRLVGGGQRYRFGHWASVAPSSPADPCSDYSSAVYFRF